jgi:hypothetical protein
MKGKCEVTKMMANMCVTSASFASVPEWASKVAPGISNTMAPMAPTDKMALRLPMAPTALTAPTASIVPKAPTASMAPTTM